MQNQSKINHIIRTLLFSLSIITLTFTTACNNDPDDTPTPTPQTCKVSKIIATELPTNSSSTNDIIYNSDFKPVTTTFSTPNQPTQINTYTYLPNGRIRVTQDNSLEDYTEYVLNSTGNIQTQYDYYLGNLITTQYEYNAEGYLIKTTSGTNSVITTYTYQNGNLQRKIWTNGTDSNTIDYEYTGGLVANSYTDILTTESLIPTGKTNKNLITKITETPTFQTTPDITNISYILDSSQKVTKMTLQYSNNTSNILDLSYTCR